MTRQPAPTGATSLHLLRTAERLFAERGIDGVSLRQIAAVAGSSNNSAIHYHYGSKDGLLRAIFAQDLDDLLRRRALRKARIAPDDLRGRFEAHIIPLLELAETPDNFYVSFVEQLQRSGAADLLANQEEVRQSREDFTTDMQRLLKHLPEPSRTMRIRQAQDLSLHVAAAREQAVNRGDPVMPFGLFASSVVDGLTAFLAAPASEETLRLAKAAKRSASTPSLHLV